MRDDTDRARALAAFPALRPIEAELAAYAALLRRWQTRINLVGPATLDHVWWRHFADSIQILQAANSASKGAAESTLDGLRAPLSIVDLGSGAGFPGLVVALALRQRATLTLVESDTRKAAFLREVSRETGAGAEVRTERAANHIARAAAPDLVLSRALAPLTALANLCQPWLVHGTIGVFLVGASEIDPTPASLCITKTPSRTGPGFVLQVKARESGRT